MIKFAEGVGRISLVVLSGRFTRGGERIFAVGQGDLEKRWKWWSLIYIERNLLPAARCLSYGIVGKLPPF